MLRALLVDDEENNLESLGFMLQHDCAGIEVAGKAGNAQQARDWLARHHADVVFLDIHMPGEDGFAFLNSLAVKNFTVIFITAYDQYAIQAIKASALDYLLKPVNIDELKQAVERLISARPTHSQQQQLLDKLLQGFVQKKNLTKIALPQLGGMSFVDVDDIVSLQADSNYTILHMTGMQKLVISKTLKDFEDLLDPEQFARIHKSYIVNLKCIKEYSTTDGGIVKMTDGNQWSISRRQLDMFLAKMKRSSLIFGR